MKNSLLTRRNMMRNLSLSMLGTAAIPEFGLANDCVPDSFDKEPTIHIKAGEGITGRIGGIELITKLNKSQTNGHFACDEATLKPGFLGAPPHLHATFDEICYVLEGTVHILVGDQVFEVKQGDWHLRPRNVIHTFWNSSDKPARFIDMYIPGGHEEYMADLARLFENNGRPQKEDFARLEKQHDIVYAWNKLPEVMNKYKVHL